MPMIYKRFTEKSAEEWRQIYKALQLLEFLIKNGSERVIDDARSHLTLLKMLRQFHFIDQNGKDQGINVRNRAKELAELLSDVERIRAERKKSRATRNKYSGVEGGSGISGGLGAGGMSSGSRYGGFGSEDRAEYGGYNGGVYGDGGGFGGQSSDFQDSGSRGGADRFEEYDEYDEGAVAAPGHRQNDSTSSTSRSRRSERTSKKPEAQPAKKKDPEVDLLSLDDSIPTSSAPAPSNIPADDDEFDDFQSASPTTQPIASSTSSAIPLPATTSTTTSYTQFAAPQPVSAPKAANLTDLVGFSSITPTTSSTATPVNYSAFSPPITSQQPTPSAYQGSQPNYFTSVPAPTVQGGVQTAASTSKPAPAKSSSASGDAFGSLWSSASQGIKKSSTPLQSPALGQLAKEKASAGIWGAAAPPPSSTQQQRPIQGQAKTGGALDDLLG
jgi:epsin